MAEEVSSSLLPPEIWLRIFEHATALEHGHFFDARWAAGSSSSSSSSDSSSPALSLSNSTTTSDNNTITLSRSMNRSLSSSSSPNTITAFDDALLTAAPRNAQTAFAASLQTKKNISLVCSDWYTHSAALVYSHIVIRRRTQLVELLKTLDRCPALGWRIRCLKLLTTDHGGANHDGAETPAEPDANAPGDMDEKEDDTALGGVATTIRMDRLCTRVLVQRLLAYCPRLQVFLDAAPYGADEPARLDLFPTLPGYPTLSSSSSFSSYSSTRDKHPSHSYSFCQPASLEWDYGSPALGDLLDPAYEHITNGLKSLRCCAIKDEGYAFTTVQGTLRTGSDGDVFIPSQLPTGLLALAARRNEILNKPGELPRPLLVMPSLVALDMAISAQSHLHWAFLASATRIGLSALSSSPSSSSPLSTATPSFQRYQQRTGYQGQTTAAVAAAAPLNGLPALTHLTIRTPPALGTRLGAPALRSLNKFLNAYGKQLTFLDMRASPGDVDDGTDMRQHHRHQVISRMRQVHRDDVNADGQGGQLPQHDGQLQLQHARNPLASFDIPRILAKCPNVEELVISARWAAPHSHSLSTHPRLPSSQSSPSPFAVLAPHLKLRKIGLRDTAPQAEGFSSDLASRDCISCSRVHTHPSGQGLTSTLEHYNDEVLTAPGRGEYAGQQSSGSHSLLPSSLADFLTGLGVLGASSASSNSDGGMHANQRNTSTHRLSHRQCTIDRHLRFILAGASPHGTSANYVPPFMRDAGSVAPEDEEDDANDDNDNDEIPEEANANANIRRASERHLRIERRAKEARILRRKFGTPRAFPALESITLLDSNAVAMFGASCAGATSSSSSSKERCWCIPLEARVEARFWNAWAERCTTRGVRVLDRLGKPIDCTPSSNTSSWSSSLKQVDLADLDEELEREGEKDAVRAVRYGSWNTGSDSEPPRHSLLTSMPMAMMSLIVRNLPLGVGVGVKHLAEYGPGGEIGHIDPIEAIIGWARARGIVGVTREILMSLHISLDLVRYKLESLVA